jgi:putative hemolysin
VSDGPLSWGAFFANVALVLAFILVAAVFVAAEIALISLRDGQVRTLGERGRRGAKLAKLAQNPNRFLAAAQVGITVSSLLSAALGAERLGRFITPTLNSWGLSDALSSVLALVIVTLVVAYVSLVLGELVPKRLALQKTETIALAAAPTIDRIAILFRPVIWLLSKSTDVVVRLFGVDPHKSRESISEEEIINLVSGHASLGITEREIVEEVFNATDRQIHEFMIPRTEVDFLDQSMSVSEARDIALTQAHSRYPVRRDSADDIVGFIHVRDLLDPARSHLGLSGFVRPLLFLPGTKFLIPALNEMKLGRHHMAIVLDEYGGTDGIITLEDIVEQILGDIHDEYDDDESVTTQALSGEYEVDGLTSLEDLAEETSIELPEGPYETLAGFILHHLGRLPEVGFRFCQEGVTFEILALDGKRISRVQMLIDPSGEISSPPDLSHVEE